MHLVTTVSIHIDDYRSTSDSIIAESQTDVTSLHTLPGYSECSRMHVPSSLYIAISRVFAHALAHDTSYDIR